MFFKPPTLMFNAAPALAFAGASSATFASAADPASKTAIAPYDCDHDNGIVHCASRSDDMGSQLPSTYGGSDGGSYRSIGKFLPSDQTIAILSERQPPKHSSGGAIKTAGALALFGATVADAWFLHDMLSSSGTSDAFSMLIAGTLGVVGLAAFAGGAYLLPRGITSLLSPHQKKDMNSAQAYYRNSGYIIHPTSSDKKYGTPLHPMDSLPENAWRMGGHLFLNGVTVRKTKHSTRTETTVTNITVGTSVIPQVNTRIVHKVELYGDFNDTDAIKAYADTDSESYAKALANNEVGSALYIRGPMDKNGWIEVDGFGEAFKPD